MILHCSQKLAAKLTGVSPVPLEETSPIGSWHGHLFALVPAPLVTTRSKSGIKEMKGVAVEFSPSSLQLLHGGEKQDKQ